MKNIRPLVAFLVCMVVSLPATRGLTQADTIAALQAELAKIDAQIEATDRKISEHNNLLRRTVDPRRAKEIQAMIQVLQAQRKTLSEKKDKIQKKLGELLSPP